MILRALKSEEPLMRRLDEITEGESMCLKAKKVCTLDSSFKGLKSRRKQTEDHSFPKKNTIERLSKEHEKNYGAFQCEYQEKIKWYVHLFLALW